MKILYVCRLYSGFEESLISGVWNPKGAPTIARMIENLDQCTEYELHIILTRKNNVHEKLEGTYDLKGLNTKIAVIAGEEKFPSWFWKFRSKASDLSQLYTIYRTYKKLKPDLVYCDRVNILPAAMLSRFTQAKVIWRVMGVLEEMHTAAKQNTIRSSLSKWLWRSPFKAVICTLDGSGGGTWMKQVLWRGTPSYLLLNGIQKDLVPDASVNLPKDGIKILFVGRLEKLKGIEEFTDAFFEAAQDNPDIIAVIAGEGSLKKHIISRANENGMQDRIIFLGSISQSQLKYVRLHCDFYISLNKQGNLSNVNLEALSDALPTIIPSSNSDLGIDTDTDDLIPQDVFYRFGKVSDKKALVDAIHFMSEPETREKFRHNAELCRDTLLPTWTARIEKEREIYRTVTQDVAHLAIVISDLGSGGAQKVACSLAKDMLAQNKRVAVITLSNQDSDFYALPPNVARICLNAQSQSTTVFQSIISNITRIFLLRKALKSVSPKVTLSFIAPTNILTIAACTGLSTRLIISERNDPARQSFGRLWDSLRKISYRFADCVTANSANAIGTLSAYVPKEKLIFVPNALHAPEPRYVIPYSKKQKIILAVGRLHPQKAHHVLLDAFAQCRKDFPEWSLVIAGEGYLKAKLMQQAQKLGIEGNVTFTGVVQNPYEHYREAQIFVLPSIHEGTPNSLLEAMSCGVCPMISDACEGAKPYIQDGISGAVFPVNDVQILARKLEELMGSLDKREKFGAAARENVSCLFSKTTADLWGEVLKI